MRQVIGLSIIDKKDTYKKEAHLLTAISVNELSWTVVSVNVL